MTALPDGDDQRPITPSVIVPRASISLVVLGLANVALLGIPGV